MLCLIRSKLHDLKRQRKERLGELLQVIDMSAPVVVAARVCCSLLLLTSHGVKVLTGMWDRLSVPVEYRARFVEKHPTLTQVDRCPVQRFSSSHAPVSRMFSTRTRTKFGASVTTSKVKLPPSTPFPLRPHPCSQWPSTPRARGLRQHGAS